MSLSAGGLDAACTDLIIAGALHTNSAQVTHVRNLIIQGGGLMDAAASVIDVGGNWSNGGTFTASGGQVNFGDDCGVDPSIVSGSNTFHNVSFVTGAGKTWQFAAGSTQTVTDVLTIQGNGAEAVNFRSTVPGEAAFIDANGPVSRTNLSVVNVTFLDQSNPAVSVPVPTLSATGILVLILLLSAAFVGTSSRRPSQKSTWGN